MSCSLSREEYASHHLLLKPIIGMRCYRGINVTIFEGGDAREVFR